MGGHDQIGCEALSYGKWVSFARGLLDDLGNLRTVKLSAQTFRRSEDKQIVIPKTLLTKGYDV